MANRSARILGGPAGSGMAAAAGRRRMNARPSNPPGVATGPMTPPVGAGGMPLATGMQGPSPMNMPGAPTAPGAQPGMDPNAGAGPTPSMPGTPPGMLPPPGMMGPGQMVAPGQLGPGMNPQQIPPQLLQMFLQAQAGPPPAQ